MATLPHSITQGFERGTPPIRLLMLGYSRDDAAVFASASRKGGLVARIESADSRPELERLLRTAAPDLIALNLDSEHVPPRIAAESVARSCPSAGLILVGRQPLAHLGFADEHRARDLIESGDHRRLALAIKREYETQQLKREVAKRNRDLLAARERFRQLLEASHDAIAYLYEGMHLEANRVYCEIFGVPREDIEGLPIMDLIATDARADFKKTLQQATHTELTGKAIPCRHPDGRVFDVDMEFSPSSCNSEACTRIIIRHPTEPNADEEPKHASEDAATLIDNALEQDRLQLLYQPIVSLNGETRESYAIFAGLADEGGQQSAPDWLTELARRTQRLAKIERWVVRHAIEELTRRKPNHKLDFHIHLSRESALDNSMLSWVCDCLREYKVKGNGLYFQFDYELLLEAPPGLDSLLDGLKKINCRIACNNLVPMPAEQALELRQPVDTARYAASVTATLRDTPESRESLAALNAEIHEKGIKTLASGVGDAETLELLWRMGVDLVQGKFLQSPLPHIYPQDRE